jgi:hypothetical protein
MVVFERVVLERIVLEMIGMVVFVERVVLESDEKNFQ